MVQRIIEIQTGERTSRTMVIECTARARGLIKVLKQALCSSNVTVYDTLGEKLWILFQYTMKNSDKNVII